MADLRAGLVGFGQMGRHHARVLNSMAGVELVGIADPAPRTDRSNQHFTFFPSVEKLVAAGLDLAVVCVPTTTHEEVAVQLAEAGVHVLIEKPIAPDAAAARRIAEAFSSRGLVSCVGHIERYNPALQEMRRRLANRELGALYQIATRRQGPFPERINDVGVVLDLATHDVDLTAWVAKRQYATLSARTAHRSGLQHEDLVAAVGTLSDGTVVNHLVNWLSPMKERVTIVTGEKGCFVADTLTADLTFYANASAPTIPTWEAMQAFRGVSEGDMVRFAIPKPEPLRTELEAFRDAVLDVDGGRERVVSMRQGLQVVRVAEAALDSAAKGATVEL